MPYYPEKKPEPSGEERRGFGETGLFFFRGVNNGQYLSETVLYCHTLMR